MWTVALCIVVAIITTVWYWITGLRRNIAVAKASGLPYIISPWSRRFLLWRITHKLLIPFIRMLPEPWWEQWLLPTAPDFAFRSRHDHFARFGDAFLHVSPSSITLYVANAEAINQIAMRRDHFPKQTEVYQILTQFGQNVLTVERGAWRIHRRATAPSFNERNAALVFREAARQSLGMLRFWEHQRAATASPTLYSVEHDAMRLSLNIISYIGFGLRLPWPNEKNTPQELDPISAKYGSVDAPPGFRFSFVDSMAILVHNILALLLVPKWLLRLMPYKSLRDAVAAHRDFSKYINEILDLKIQEARDGESHTEGMDLMGQLVRLSYERGPDGTPIKSSKTLALARDEIIGNTFIMLVAGHDSTATTTHFALLYLAGSPATQRRLQRELDEVAGDNRDPETWDYDEMLGPLMGGMVGACINETMRLIPPVGEIPKVATSDLDQPIVMDGRKYMIPRGTVISLCAASVHANPRYWPTRPSKLAAHRSDILDYVPERWIRSGDYAKGATAATVGGEGNQGGEVDGADKEDYGGYQGHDTSAQLFRPEPGAYIPFSQGPRACLARRFAMVEVVAALAVLLREYSVELAVDEWASDDDVARMSREEMAQVYERARVNRDEAIAGARSVLAVKLNGQAVGLRIVRRGEERFVNWLEGGRDK